MQRFWTWWWRGGAMRWVRLTLIPVSGFMLWIGYGLIGTALQSMNWEATPATIARVTVGDTFQSADSGGSIYYPVIHYRYEVDGLFYENTVYKYGQGERTPRGFNGPDAAAAHGKTAYPVGTPLTVYVNPADPSQAVVEPGAGWSVFVPLAIGLSLAVLVLYVPHDRQNPDRPGDDAPGT